MDSGGGFPGDEAIPAVQDEDQFYAEDDDYDDLYNDVNVGEAFRHSLHTPDEPRPEPSWGAPAPAPNPPPPLPPSAIPPVGGQPPPRNVQIPVIAGEPKMERPVEMPPGALDQMGTRPPAPPQPLPPVLPQQQRAPAGGSGAGFANEGFQRQGGSFVNEVRPAGGGNVNGAGGDGGPLAGATLFVGDLHWWTTDADLEAEVSKYGQVKEIKFFDEKASGKSKGYCQVDLYDPAAAQACKEGMNGHLFNGRPCVVAMASPFTVRRMGEAQLKNQQGSVGQSSAAPPPRGRGSVGQQTGENYGRGGGNYGRGGGNGGGPGGNWGRGGMGNRGQMGNMRNRMGPTGGRGVIGNGGMMAPHIPPMHPAAMLGQGFDPSGYGAAMGRMAGAYGGFPPGSAAAHFPPIMPSFPPVVAPHVNPAFFGRGGMMPGNVGMWPDPNMSGWGGEEQSSYGDDAASDQQYGEGSHGKDRGPDRYWSGAPDRRYERENDLNMGQERSERRHLDEREMGQERFERRHLDEREMGRERDSNRDSEREREREKERERDRERERERDKYRDDRDRHGEHYRHRDQRELERKDDRDRSRSSRPRSKSREVDHSKRRRLSPH